MAPSPAASYTGRRQEGTWNAQIRDCQRLRVLCLSPRWQVGLSADVSLAAVYLPPAGSSQLHNVSCTQRMDALHLVKTQGLLAQSATIGDSPCMPGCLLADICMRSSSILYTGHLPGGCPAKASL
ncbi:hypothetical protein WJX74_009415 [Apatococcus lobatus]|uniref:Uncharacterized protein n=1 Tax=Apatococcus lobatus TaxID=904363 RepID=A0AAW1QDS1_9CHLO